jgi:hypothetical protein
LEERKRETTNLVDTTVPMRMPPKVEVGEWRGMVKRKGAETARIKRWRYSYIT